jgi:hypothetical protein
MEQLQLGRRVKTDEESTRNQKQMWIHKFNVYVKALCICELKMYFLIDPPPGNPTIAVCGPQAP